MYIPEKLCTSAMNRWKNEGQAWIDSLSSIAQECCVIFDITLGTPYENAYANFVCSAQKLNGTEVVLKIGFPNSEAVHERHVLKAFAGKKCVAVLAEDAARTAVLIEKIDPGYDLESVTSDEEATKIAAQIMKNIPSEILESYEFPSVTDWLSVTDRIGTNHTFPIVMIDKAKQLHQELNNNYSERKLLHGDLHHNNILFDAKRGWIAIDPQGVVGDPICEVGQYFHNPHGIEKREDLEHVLLKRAEIFADVLECDIQRVLGRAFVQSVISCCWGIEDNDKSWQQSFVISKVLEELLSNQ